MHEKLKWHLEQWLERTGHNWTFERSINPPGNWLQIEPAGLRLFVSDTTAEDNLSGKILTVLENALSDRLHDPEVWTLWSDLRLEKK